MRYISVFSGIEAASVALDGMGWEPVAFSEIEPFPCAVLAARYPDVPNLGDITKIDWSPYRGSVDVVVGGSPCQSFSIAGSRESLRGESALCFEYYRAVRDIAPRWFLWENVPGVFSTRDNAFGQFLGKMEELGYSMAWRTLDAQFFGVAQRRRRVFLVGHIGDGFAPAAVLFEPESVPGNTQSSREKRKELARAAGRGASSGGFKFHQGARAGSIGYEPEQSPSLTADYHNPACLTPWDTQTARIYSDSDAYPTVSANDNGGQNRQAVLTFAQNVRGEVRVQGDGSMSGALSAEQGMNQTTYLAAMAFNPAQITSPQNGNNPQPGDPCQTLDTDSRASVVYALQSDGSTSINSHGNGWQDDGSAYTLNLMDRQSVVCLQDGQANGGICDDHAPTLNAMHEQPIVIDRAAYNQGENAAYPPPHRADGSDGPACSEGSPRCSASNGEDVVSALCARDWKGVGSQYVTDGKVVCQPTS